MTSGLNGPTLYNIAGTWTGQSKYTKGSKDGKEGQVFLDADEHVERVPISVKPVEQQGEYESRRAWKAVADGIRNGDYDAASTAKGTLENAERQKRKDEQADGAPFELRLFEYVPNDPAYTELASKLKFKVRILELLSMYCAEADLRGYVMTQPDTEDSWVLKPSVSR